MRWTNLTIEAEEQRALPGYRDEAVVRRFDAPEALDTRFYEVRAKSALNRVPEASRVPFRWTINPYRGCSHACTYCCAPETPVLMADGRQKAIGELVVGDEIIGTRPDGGAGGRRYVRTRVLDAWSVVKPAWRTVLEDGSEIVTSGDHRFLARRGWTYVARVEEGAPARPHLTVGTALLGPGPSPPSPGAIEGLAVENPAAPRVAAVEALGDARRLVDITTGTGDFVANGIVSHNCFARPTHTFLGFDAGRDFEREIVVKVNVPEVLRVELRRPSWRREHVALGTNTDPYQWVEGRYRLMRGIWAALRDAATPCSVLTKSPLLLRDLDLFRELCEVTDFSASLSIPTMDEAAWRASEPRTPNPRARMEAVAELNRAGIPCGVLVAPLMPGINDDPRLVEEILTLAAEAGAVNVGGIALHLRGEVRGVFMDWLRSYRPDLVEHYEQLYARGAYAPRAEQARIAGLLRRPGGPPPSRFELARERDREPPPGRADWRGAAGSGGEPEPPEPPAARAPRHQSAQAALF